MRGWHAGLLGLAFVCGLTTGPAHAQEKYYASVEFTSDPSSAHFSNRGRGHEPAGTTPSKLVFTIGGGNIASAIRRWVVDLEVSHPRAQCEQHWVREEIVVYRTEEEARRHPQKIHFALQGCRADAKSGRLLSSKSPPGQAAIPQGEHAIRAAMERWRTDLKELDGAESLYIRAVNRSFDLPTMARVAMGPEVQQSATLRQQARTLTLLTAQLERDIRKGLAKEPATVAPVKEIRTFEPSGQTFAGILYCWAMRQVLPPCQAAFAKVATVATSSGGNYPVNYYLAELQTGWRIIDFDIEGYSPPVELARYVRRILKAEGVSGLLDKLERNEKKASGG
jgi:hypothetical protein